MLQRPSLLWDLGDKVETTLGSSFGSPFEIMATTLPEDSGRADKPHLPTVEVLL